MVLLTTRMPPLPPSLPSAHQPPERPTPAASGKVGVRAGRMPMVDVLKGVSCMLIVLHHLAFYGPMSDVALPLAPLLIGWLYDYGRMAVQVFLVLGGYLAAASLAPQGIARFDSATQQIARRFVRLVVPYAVALVLALLAAALVRPWLDNPSVPDEPSLVQLLAHVLLLQGLLGQDSLSAGGWYVAIDFQLFALTVLGLTLARRLQSRTAQRAPWGMLLVGCMALASLLYFNLHAALDDTALYFFGAYGLGMLAFWAGRSPHARYWLVLLALLGVLALVLQFRGRIAVALVVALWLGVAQAWPRLQQWPRHADLQAVGQMSYSVFLIHFPVCLLVNAVVSHLWPTQPLVNLLGMLVAFGLSLLAGAVLYRCVEARPVSVPKLLGIQAGLVVVGLVA